MYTVFGGDLRPQIDLTVHGKPPVTLETARANLNHCKSLNLPHIKEREAWGRHLAVVGGGPSIKEKVERIKSFSDVWAINGAWKWCHDNGIPATLFMVDPHPDQAMFCYPEVDRAILAEEVCPEAFERLKNAHVRVFQSERVKGGGCAASVTPHAAAIMGFHSITLFGCESSYDLKARYAYGKQDRPDQMLIECGGELFLTAADYYVYVQELSALCRELPEFIREESGGLLSAMVKHKEFRVKWISEKLAKDITSYDPDRFEIQRTPLQIVNEAPAYSFVDVNGQRDVLILKSALLKELMG